MRSRSLLPLLALLASPVLGACHRIPAPQAPAPAAPASEAVLLRLRSQPGDAHRYVAVMDGYIHLGPGEPPTGDSVRPTMHMVQFVTESVTAVSGDTFTIAFISDSSRTTMLGFNAAGASLDSLAPRGLTMTTRVDSRGRVIAVQLERPVLANGRMATLRTMLPGGDSLAESGFGKSFHFPELPVRVGATWADTAPCPRVLHCAEPRVTTYRLERIEQSDGRRIAVIGSETDMPPTAVDTPMAISSGPTHIVGEERLDLGAGWGVGLAMTMTGTAHTQMGDVSMRMQMRETPAPPAAASGAGAPPAAPAIQPRILMRRGPVAPPGTLDSLMALFRHFEPTLEFPVCRLPDVATAPDWADFAGPDSGLRIRLPPPWRAGPPDSTFFGDPEAVLEDSASSRIRISRVRTASGRESLRIGQAYGLPTERPHAGPCRTGAGLEGSIWTFYGPVPDMTAGGPPRYVALGDLITAKGRRYRITVGARTAEARDRVVRMVADAAQTPR